jgi:hypothetical protein
MARRAVLNNKSTNPKSETLIRLNLSQHPNSCVPTSEGFLLYFKILKGRTPRLCNLFSSLCGKKNMYWYSNP